MLFLAACGQSEAPGGDREARVLVIGIDGLRTDALQGADTPNIDRLIAEGAFDDRSQVDYVTVSGPGWSSMLTGVWCDKHGVRDNSFDGSNYDAYPHFYRHVRELRPDLVTVSYAHWAPINENILRNEADIVGLGSDEEVAQLTAKALRERDVHVVFADFDDVDHAGHSCCFSPLSANYRDAIELTDRYVGVIVDALKSRPRYAEENWLVLMATDHGGSGVSHGRDEPEHRNTWFLSSGAASAPLTPGSTRVTDLAVTAMIHLGIAIRPEWNLDGIAVGLKNAPAMTRRESRNSCEAQAP
ncbi:alkaline phosphatase family protein [Solimonas sp. K1W22B-7]|uniref:alkaline phosphatase family protein n=1 Tax=Solimonas sp. K1W22B-7 TaxID=2303331 RepID=UPI0013C4D26E|nr:alkaline phosphatase family protein [Solimonas sp. K1W22B-7]